MNWIDEKIKEGKAKIGVCDLKECEAIEDELLFRVKDQFVCGTCLDEIEIKMTKLGMI